MKKFFCNERGAVFFSVIFLTLIISVAAALLIHSTNRIKNPQAVLRLTAIHLANEQFAIIESRAADGNLSLGNISWQGMDDDLTTKNLGENFPVTFDVQSNVKNFQSYENLRKVEVKVGWTVGQENYELEFERVVKLAENSSGG